MSSLLQFGGQVTRAGVHLQFVKVVKGEQWERYNGPGAYQPSPDSTVFTEDDPAHTYTCQQCGRVHARIYVAVRKPAGMFGVWVVFRYNGEEHVPDLSIPISTFKLPRDARPLSDEESSKVWHS